MLYDDLAQVLALKTKITNRNWYIRWWLNLTVIGEAKDSYEGINGSFSVLVRNREGRKEVAVILWRVKFGDCEHMHG